MFDQKPVLAYLWTLTLWLYLASLGYLIRLFITTGYEMPDALLALYSTAGGLIGALNISASNFYFGSSESSKSKDEVLRGQLK